MATNIRKLSGLRGHADRIINVPVHVEGYVREFEEMIEAREAPEPESTLDDEGAAA